MLTPIELKNLRKKKHYKKTVKVFKNRHYLKGYKIFPNTLVDASIKAKFNLNEKYVRVSVPLKILIVLTKRYHIIKEITKIRYEIIEQALNGTIHKYNLSDIFDKSYIWFEPNYIKIKFMKNATMTDVLYMPDIELEIFEVCKSISDEKEKENRYAEILEELDEKFERMLEKCNSSSLINSYLAYGDPEEIASLITQHYNSGTLTDEPGKE